MSTLLEVMVRPTEKYKRFTRRCAHEKEEDTLADHLLICRDCNQECTFTSGEQEWYASRGLTNIPSRCPVYCSECDQPPRTDQHSAAGRAGKRYDPHRQPPL